MRKASARAEWSLAERRQSKTQRVLEVSSRLKDNRQAIIPAKPLGFALTEIRMRTDGKPKDKISFEASIIGVGGLGKIFTFPM